jgi:hypothetical protein
MRRLSIVAGAIVAIAIVTIAASILVLTFVNDDDDEAPPPPPSSVDELYRRMSQAIVVDGQVLYSRTHAVFDASGREATFYVRDLWIDGGSGVSRQNWDWTLPSSAKETRIMKDGLRHAYSDAGEITVDPHFYHCADDSDPMLAELLECYFEYGSYTFSASTFETDDVLNGESVFLIRWNGESSEPQQTLTFVVYIDPATYLPIAWTGEQADAEGTRRVRADYEHEFVPAESLHASFFDPESLDAMP